MKAKPPERMTVVWRSIAVAWTVEALPKLSIRNVLSKATDTVFAVRVSYVVSVMKRPAKTATEAASEKKLHS